MSSTIQPSYTATSALTITLASLASSSTLVAGRQSTVVSNLSSLYDDVLLSGKITVGTSPTASTEIDIWVFAPLSDDLSATVTYPDTLGASDANVTITSAAIRNAALKLAAVLVVDSTTSDRAYYFDNISIARLFGGRMPTRWGVWVTHSTGVALNATGGNHAINAIGVQDVIV